MDKWNEFSGQLTVVKELAEKRNDSCISFEEDGLRREMVNELAERYFDELVGAMVGKFSRRYLQLVEEGVQEAFLVLYEKMEQLRSESWREVKGWLRTTARNLIWERIKDQKRRIKERSALLLLLEDKEKNQGDEVLEGQFGSELAQKLSDFLRSDRITDRERELLALLLEGCPPARIRQVLGVSTVNLRQIRYRLREKLRSFLFTAPA